MRRGDTSATIDSNKRGGILLRLAPSVRPTVPRPTIANLLHEHGLTPAPEQRTGLIHDTRYVFHDRNMKFTEQLGALLGDADYDPTSSSL